MLLKGSVKVLENKSSSIKYSLPQKDISVAIHHSINDVPADWEVAAPSKNIFLQRTYLQLLEDNPPPEVHFVYLLFYKNEKPIGVSIGQVGNFNAEKSIKEEDKKIKKAPKGAWNNVTNFFKSFVAKKVDITAMVCGNALLSGEHHNVYFKDGEVDEEDEYCILSDSMKYIDQELKKKGLKISLVYLKEYHDRQRNSALNFLVKKNKYHEFTAQPNMILDFREDWKSFEDYMAAMSSKYRVRVKRAFKKGKDIERRDFSLEDIQTNLERIYPMYEKIADASVFNLVKLNPQYFVALKEKFEEDFTMTGYYIEEKLVAFFTTIKNYDELEAHFLGYDAAYNRDYQMYLNILYDIVKIGFQQNCRSIVFSRTALEIKSSVGAEPHQMYWYLKHRNKFTNQMLSQIVDYLNPKEEWVQRKPFKDQA